MDVISRRARFSFAVFAVYSLLLGAPLLFSASPADRIPIRLLPDSHSSIRSLLVPTLPVRLLRIEGTWAEVTQGSATGWVSVDELPFLTGLESRPATLSPFAEGVFATTWAGRDRWGKLVDFVFGSYELEKMMSDLYYRDRITGFTRAWGPFFYERTTNYYVRGLNLFSLRERLNFRLAKRRLFYRELLGSFCSDQLLDSALEGNKGILRNRDLFGKGREYFLEVNFPF